MHSCFWYFKCEYLRKSYPNVSSLESEGLCNCLFGESILPLSTIKLLESELFRKCGICVSQFITITSRPGNHFCIGIDANGKWQNSLLIWMHVYIKNKTSMAGHMQTRDYIIYIFYMFDAFISLLIFFSFFFFDLSSTSIIVSVIIWYFIW